MQTSVVPQKILVPTPPPSTCILCGDGRWVGRLLDCVGFMDFTLSDVSYCLFSHDYKAYRRAHSFKRTLFLSAPFFLYKLCIKYELEDGGNEIILRYTNSTFMLVNGKS